MKPNLTVISFGRVGTMAINRFLNVHPQIVAPSYQCLPLVINSKDRNLDHFGKVKDKKVKIKAMVVHHGDYLDTNHQDELNFIRSLKTKKIIHLVRNPFDQALSWLNNAKSRGLIGASGWKPIESFDKFLQDHPYQAITLKQGLQAQGFYNKGAKSSKVKLLDFNDLLEVNIHKTMADIYQFLKINSTFKSDIFTQQQNSLTENIMAQGIEFELNGEKIQIAMKPSSISYLEIEDFKPWITLHDTNDLFEKCPSLVPCKGDIELFIKDMAEFQKLKYSTREMFLSNTGNIISEALEEWARRAELVGLQVKKTKMSCLSDKDRDDVFNFIKDDLEIFTDYHPEYKSKWDL